MELLPSEIATQGVVRKSESTCARPASAIPKNQKNWMISYLYPRIIVKNRYQETSILEKSEWKTSFQPITESREFLFMSTKDSNQPRILLMNQTRRLYIHLNGYFTIIGVQPSIQEPLKITMPSSGIEKLPHHKICQNKFLILLGQNEDMAGMKLTNEGISLCALLQIIMAKQHRSWRMYKDSQQIIQCYIHCQDCIEGLFCWLLKYSKMSLNSPYHFIILNHRREHNKRLHAHAIIHEQLVFAIGLPIDWDKCHNLGESIVIPQVIVHANNILADKGITAIHDPKIPPNIFRERSCQGPGWFRIPFIKSCSSVWTLFIDCTDIGKIRLAEKLRIKNKLWTALQLVQKDIMEPFLLVHSGLSTSPVGALPFKAGEHNSLQHICVWNLGTSDVFNIIHPYYYLTENEQNSRTSTFEEGAPDVGQILDQITAKFI